MPHPLPCQLLDEIKTTVSAVGLVLIVTASRNGRQRTFSLDHLGYHDNMSCSVKMSTTKSTHLIEAGPKDSDGQEHNRL